MMLAGLGVCMALGTPVKGMAILRSVETAEGKIATASDASGKIAVFAADDEIWGADVGDMSFLSGRSGDGSKEKPYQLTTKEHLIGLAVLASMGMEIGSGEGTYPGNYRGAWFELGKNIDLSGMNWIPIGFYRTGADMRAGKVSPFEGHFDGNGKTVSNFRMYQPSWDFGGLFGMVENAEITDLKVKPGHVITVKENGGILAGRAKHSVIRNVTVNGTLRTTGTVGGVTADVLEDSVVENCVSDHVAIDAGSGKEIFMKKNNRLLIVVFAVLALIIGVLKGVDYYRYTKVSKERVSSIQAEFVGETAPSQELSMSMFDVTVYTETGSVYSARSFDIDEKKAPAHGDSFDTKIEYHGSTTTVTVPITRSKVVQYKVGYPTKENVLATIYNNGDLEFTGSGNTMNFANGDTPWADEDYTYVIFKDEITPTNVDYWFEGNTALTGCETLPKSIESARGTFQGCENLKKTPSFFQCSSLKIITDCFSGCTSLEQSDPLPVSVMEADGAFEDCIKLTKAPDMTKTNALSSINAIFKGCTSLVDAPVIPDSVLDMSEAFLGDSNIYTASAFPESVEDISSAYADCISLEKAASIPASVINCDSCYSGCSNLYGELSINTNTEDCANLLSNAVTSGKTLKLKGKSGRLFEIQQDSGSRYVTIKDTEKAEKNAKKLERQNNQ